MNLLSCPFCAGEGELIEKRERHGYGEYERNIIFHVVECKKCHSHGRRYEQKALIDFTSHTVQDFRNNPVLRAKVEDEYNLYITQIKELAVSSWNKREKNLESNSR